MIDLRAIKYFNTTLILSILFRLATFTFAQQGDGGNPKVLKGHLSIKSSDLVTFMEPNIERLREEDNLNEQQKIGPWRFGFNHITNLNADSSGKWIILPNGDQIWFLGIKCKNALSVNLSFAETFLPIGNELYVYNPKKDFILGKFTQNHIYEGQLGTELIPGDEVIVEYYVPKGNSKGSVKIATVTHGYRTPVEFLQKSFGNSGFCNRNVNCPEGVSWANERNGVVMLVSGSNGFCTGALINNVLNDGKPYVLTADHCYSNPANWVFRFNWQSDDCDNPPTPPTFQSLSGSVLRARGTASDFCLVEITGGLVDGSIPTSFSPYFCGWDNSGATPQSAVGIHHPTGDIKKISIENNQLISTSFGTDPANSHWGVTSWESGVTEGGSSGSPLFDQNHHIIGQLHGGASACGTPIMNDEYGKFSFSWNPSGSSSSGQLKYWLDPKNSGAQFIDGFDPSGSTPVQIDAGITNPKGVNGRLCSTVVKPSVTITNSGSETLTYAEIQYSFDGGATQTYIWTGTLPQWQSSIVSLPVTNLDEGNHTFVASIKNPNESGDQNNNNDKTSTNFSVIVNGAKARLDVQMDCYGSEISWELLDVNNKAIYFSPGYPDNSPGLVQEQWCLNSGCYSFFIKDSYGDGLSGDPSCSPEGSLRISQGSDSLTGIPQEDANFGSQKPLSFCINQGSIDEQETFSFSLFPNPADEKITITFNKLQSIQLEIISVLGQVLVVEKVNSVDVVLDTSTFSSGTYFVRVKSNDRFYLQKLVIN
jgi:hypothetical protein